MGKFYSIHDIVTFSIQGKVGRPNRLFSNWDIELQAFESKGAGNPSFTISLGGFTPNNQDCCLLDDKYYIREDYFYCHDSYKHAKWELEMSGFEQGDMSVRISANFFGWMLIPEFIINPLIWFRLNESGYPIIHGSAISREGRSHLFAGPGASGKTTIALSIVEKGFKLLGDHFVILGDGDALSYPSPFHIMDYNLAPLIRANMGISNKVSFYFKQLFRKMTGRRVATKIRLRDILPSSLVDRAKPCSIFLLLPREKLNIERIDREELISHLVISQKLEYSPFDRYMMEYSYLFPESNMATYWARYEENLSRALGPEIATFKVEVPLKYNLEILDELKDEAAF